MDLGALLTTEQGGRARFEVRAKPRASKSRIVGVKEGALEVAIAAPPVDGAANAELVATLARALGIAKSGVTIVRGESGKHKLVEVALDAATLRARLTAAC